MSAEVVIYLVSFAAGFVLLYVICRLWANRRPVLRKDVPTGKEPWVTPKPWRDDDQIVR